MPLAVDDEVDMADEVKLGYIGLGNMGAPMAERIASWPGGLIVYDVRADAMTPLAEAGATLADSIADVATADIISITVLNDEQVRDVVAGENGIARHAKPGTVIAIHSTISDTTAVELANQLRPQGIHVIDAPVSGGAGAAKKGELATMIGADDEAFAKVKEPFSHWASLIVHAGAPGAGTRMKVARNLITFVGFAAATEAERLAEQCGLDLGELGKVVRHTDALTGGAGAIMYRKTTAPMDPTDFFYQPFTHSRDLGEKDLNLALALAADRGIALPIAEVAVQHLGTGLGVPHPTTEVQTESG